MTAAISPVTRADRPNRHDGSQRNRALIVSAADSARPAGRLRRRPPITAAMTNGAAAIAHPSDEAATVAKPAGTASAHHGLGAPAHATKPAKQAVSTTSAGRHAVGCAATAPRRPRTAITATTIESRSVIRLRRTVASPANG